MNVSPSETSTVLVLGANGRLGSSTARAFAAAGWKVFAQMRRRTDGWPRGVTILVDDLADPASFARRVARADVVVHAVNPAYTRWDEALPALRAGLGVAEGLCAHFMFPGNVYNYGADMPSVLREDTPQRPSTKKGEIRVAMETLIAERATRGGFTASVVRAGDFFGAGRGNWFDEAIVKSLPAGKLVYPGPVDLPHAWAYLPDLARSFVRVASQPHATPFEVWHFAGHTLTGSELLTALEQVATDLALAPPGGFRRGRMPWGLVRTIGLVLPLWRELARMSYLWRTPHSLDGARLAALPGQAQELTPLRVALLESLLDLGFARRDGRPAVPGAELAASPRR